MYVIGADQGGVDGLQPPLHNKLKLNKINKSTKCLRRITANSLVTDKPVALKFRIKLEFNYLLVFEERGKPEYPEKNL